MYWLTLTRRKKVFYALAGAHLLVLASGMTGWRKHAPRPLRLGVNGYEAVTGAGGGFGFFSPNVGHQLVVSFEVQGRDGATRTVAMEDFLPREVAIRVGNMVRLFAYSYEKEKYRRSLAASFSANIFERYPEASQVKLLAYAYQFPGVAQYRDGQRPSMEPVYQISFRRRTQ